MHANSGRGERVVGGENQGAPVLAIFVRCFRRARQDVVPSVDERG